MWSIFCYIYIRNDSTRRMPHFEGSDGSIHQGQVTVTPSICVTRRFTTDLSISTGHSWQKQYTLPTRTYFVLCTLPKTFCDGKQVTACIAIDTMCYDGLQGLYSLSSKTSYRQISWSLEAARLDVLMIVSLLNLAGISATLLPRCLSNFGAIGEV